MVSDLDIYRSARLLVAQHGDDAGLEAAMRADAMLDTRSQGQAVGLPRAKIMNCDRKD